MVEPFKGRVRVHALEAELALAAVILGLIPLVLAVIGHVVVLVGRPAEVLRAVSVDASLLIVLVLIALVTEGRFVSVHIEHIRIPILLKLLQIDVGFLFGGRREGQSLVLLLRVVLLDRSRIRGLFNFVYSLNLVQNTELN